MGMAKLQFYKNKYYYPHYSENLTSYGTSMDCTPVGMNLRSGTLRVKGDMTDFMSCNYLAFTRDFQTLYAWIDDVKFRTEDSFEVTYTVDAWRTYKSKVALGAQFIARRPQATFLPDNLLGSSSKNNDIIMTDHTIGNPNKRVFVVQVRTASGEIFSRTPVQPTPYQFYMIAYDPSNWSATQPLDQLMTKLIQGAKPVNIVTMYSIPWINLSSLPVLTPGLPVKTADSTSHIAGFSFLGSQDPRPLLKNEMVLSFGGDLDTLMRTPHTAQIIIPEAGIINVSDDVLARPNVVLRQDIDLFSGACNYMLTSDGLKLSNSVRGSSVASIPIVSDPLDTYLSQNQNALTTSLIGDVASIVGGVATAVGTGGLGAGIGAGIASSGVQNIVSRFANQADMANQYSNPPAFLGTAMATNFNGRFWTLVTKMTPDNATLVHNNYGYAYGKIDTLTFPTSGFIQTEGCAVTSTDGSVPRWALEEINGNFNSGIHVH